MTTSDLHRVTSRHVRSRLSLNFLKLPQLYPYHTLHSSPDEVVTVTPRILNFSLTCGPLTRISTFIVSGRWYSNYMRMQCRSSDVRHTRSMKASQEVSVVKQSVIAGPCRRGFGIRSAALQSVYHSFIVLHRATFPCLNAAQGNG